MQQIDLGLPGALRWDRGKCQGGPRPQTSGMRTLNEKNLFSKGQRRGSLRGFAVNLWGGVWAYDL